MGSYRLVSLLSGKQAIVLNGLVPKGAYDNDTTYVQGDSVDYLGSSYVALVQTTGNLPTNTTYWQVLAEKGEQGDGSNVRSYTWVVSRPVVGGVPGPRLPENHTVVRIDSFVAEATSVTFNIEERTSIGTSGVDILTSDQTADLNGSSSTTFSNASLSADNWLWIDISDVVGVPEKLIITLSYSVT